MKNHLRMILAAAIVLAAALPARAQTADALYQQLGGAPGMATLADRFVTRLLDDDRTRRHFRDADQKRLRQQLATQFCEVSGGPCRLEGKDRDMKTKHEGADVTKADFNAVIEVLQQTLDGQGVPFGVQNRLLAKLAPMHREIVNVK